VLPPFSSVRPLAASARRASHIAKLDLLLERLHVGEQKANVGCGDRYLTSLQCGLVNAGNWINLAGVIIAGVSATLAVRSARRARKAASAAAEHERQALEAAQDAAGHAKRSADAEERVATVAESQERREISERSAVERFPWKLLPTPGRDDCIFSRSSPFCAARTNRTEPTTTAATLIAHG
jgi:hypothetical protein